MLFAAVHESGCVAQLGPLEMSDFSPQIAPKRTSHLSQYMSTGANLLRLPDPPFLSLGQAQGSGTKDSLGGGIRVSYVPVKAVVLGKRRGSYVGSSLSLCCCWALCLVQCRGAGVSGDGCAVRVQQQQQNNGQQLVLATSPRLPAAPRSRATGCRRCLGHSPTGPPAGLMDLRWDVKPDTDR
jgi:hypothetical protein